MTGEQFRLEFPRPDVSLDSLFTGVAGLPLLKALRNWKAWPRLYVVLTGARRSGVSTALQSWADEIGGRCLAAEEWAGLDPAGIQTLLTQPLALDDVDTIRPSNQLLTMINLAVDSGTHLLLGGHDDPAGWHQTPPDLVSRLTSATKLEIPALDDISFRRRIRSACLHRFIDLPDETLNFLEPRLERSFLAIEAFADTLDTAMTTKSRAPSIPLAREVLSSLSDEDIVEDEIS